MRGLAGHGQETGREEYDLIVIGGGFSGAMLLLEAARSGLKCLLLEKADFGSATSFNSLRIVHGGFRYLQTMDLLRFQTSVTERKWWLKNFPEFVHPLPCLMPLYAGSLKSPLVLRLALGMNDLLSSRRNHSMPESQVLPSGKVIGVSETRALFPAVEKSGLQGAAVWYDAVAPDSHRLVMEILRSACRLDAHAVNYMRAENLLDSGGKVAGVSAVDEISGEHLEFRAGTVVNASGPWSRSLAAKFDRDMSHLFTRSLAWNILFDRPALSDHAVAVAPKRPGGQLHFAHQYNGRLLVGTGHAGVGDSIDEPVPTGEQLDRFISDINEAVPGLNLSRREILHILSGFLPVKSQGSADLTKRDVVIDHGRHGGPEGLYSVSAIKFTTVRRLAMKVIKLIGVSRSRPNIVESMVRENQSIGDQRILTREITRNDISASQREALLKQLINEESVVHLEDLLFRRLNLMDRPELAAEIAREAVHWFDWSDQRQSEEIRDVDRWVPYHARSAGEV